MEDPQPASYQERPLWGMGREGMETGHRKRTSGPISSLLGCWRCGEWSSLWVGFRKVGGSSC